MKLKRKHYWLISAGVIILLSLLLYMMIPSSLSSIDPDDYKDNPELYKLVCDIKNDKMKEFDDYNYEKLSKDSRFFNICLTLTEETPSYSDFIRKEFKSIDLTALGKIQESWKNYCFLKTIKNAFFMQGLVLSEKENPRAYPILIRYLNSEWPIYRDQAASALGELADKRAIEPLISALRDREASIRINAAWALNELADERAIEPLISVLNDKDNKVRYNAICGLAKLKAKQAVKPLEELLKTEEDKEVRVEIKKAIYILKNDEQARN